MEKKYVENYFTMSKESTLYIQSLTPKFKFGVFGELIYYRTYSRQKENGEQETWNDTIIRVTNGIMSIRKDWYIKNVLEWDDTYWQKYALKFAEKMFCMKFSGAGRSLWALGTDQVYVRGSAALFNCGAVTTKNLLQSTNWTMDMLMNGVGIGFDTAFDGTDNKYIIPDKNIYEIYQIPDTRQGWVDSVSRLIKSYINLPFVNFDYSVIRPSGQILKHFGGIASGYEPLKKLHTRVEAFMDNFVSGKATSTRTIVDIMNAIGACVVSGNIRRSAEICLGNINNEEFLDLKNYAKYPERSDIAWMSNNSVVLKDSEDFENVGKLIQRIIVNGEPGILNLKNIQKFGRYGKEMHDDATLSNPCGEIALESYELCNLSEVFPTNCESEEEFYEVLEYATFLSSTVALLPTHRHESNKIIYKNRRIGVSLSGIADWKDQIGEFTMIRILRKGYNIVKAANKLFAEQAGIRESIRITTVKPSGTQSLIFGVSPGIHHPIYKYAIRRIRVAMNQTIAKLLIDANIPYEKDVYSDNTWCFEFPIYQGETREVGDVDIYEQLSDLELMQREWSDNMVSCTINFKKSEESKLIHALAHTIPVIKSVSLLPYSDSSDTPYKQMPYEKITKEEYEKRKEQITSINWNKLNNNISVETVFCSNDKCEVII